MLVLSMLIIFAVCVCVYVCVLLLYRSRGNVDLYQPGPNALAAGLELSMLLLFQVRVATV